MSFIVKTLGAAILLGATVISGPTFAQNDDFHPGTVITEFGPVATVEQDMKIPANADFRVAFDVAKGAEPGELNRSLVSAARFINMHAEAGVDPADIEIAIVVHGGASWDLVRQTAYGEKNEGAENANVALIEKLLENNVQIILCGQSAAAHEIGKGDLLPGVQMALSAMTAHALLQQQGYTLNPF